MRPEVFASFVEHLDRLAQDPLEKQAEFAPEAFHLRCVRGEDGVIRTYREPGPFPIQLIPKNGLGPQVAAAGKSTVEKALPALAAAGLGIGAASGIPALVRAGLGPGMWSMLRRGAVGTGLGVAPAVGYYGAKGVQDMMGDRP